MSFVLSIAASFLPAIPSKISQAVRVPFQLLAALYRCVKNTLFPDRRATPPPSFPKPSPNSPFPQACSPTHPPPELSPNRPPLVGSPTSSLSPPNPLPNPPSPQTDSPTITSPDLCPRCFSHTTTKPLTFAETFAPFREALATVTRKESDCVENWQKSTRRVKRSTISSLVTQFEQLEAARHLLRCAHFDYTTAFSQLSPDTQAVLEIKPSDASPFLKPNLRLQQLCRCLTSLAEKKLKKTDLLTMDSLTKEDKRLFSAFIALS